MKRNLFEEINEQVGRVLPRAGALGEDARRQISQAIQRVLERMDLPTREEFDRQQRSLKQAEDRISELEAVIARLESAAHQPAESAPDSDMPPPPPDGAR